MRNSLYLAVIIYTLAFWIWRIPFLIWLPLPEVLPDTFDYFAIVKYWHDGTPLSLPSDLPLAFPFLAYIAGLVCKKIMVIIWAHFLIKFFSGLLLIYVFWKNFRWWAVPVAILISFYITDSFSLRFDTCLQTESLYNSFLILTTAFLAEGIASRKKLPLVLLSVSMFLAASARPNGLYIYFLLPVLFWVFSDASQRAVKYFCLAAPALLLHASVFGIKASMNFPHPKFDRVSSVITREQGLIQASGESYFHRKWKVVGTYARMEDLPSFYFSLLPERYKQLYEFDIIRDPDYKMYDWTAPISDDLRRFVYMEYYDEPPKLKGNKSMLHVSYASLRHPLFLLIHVFYKIQSVIFRNGLWYALGFILSGIGMVVSLRSRGGNCEALLLCIFGAMHFISLLVVSVGHDTIQMRYVHVSEFLLYLLPVISLMLILPAYNNRNR
ncbi:MAG TPA: hypothetical protein VNJ07_01220 [Chitinophagales bacterium]|nr:hypothetical protein [Chitinophagales bacterium]